MCTLFLDKIRSRAEILVNVEGGGIWDIWPEFIPFKKITPDFGKRTQNCTLLLEPQNRTKTVRKESVKAAKPQTSETFPLLPSITSPETHGNRPRLPRN